MICGFMRRRGFNYVYGSFCNTYGNLSYIHTRCMRNCERAVYILKQAQAFKFMIYCESLRTRKSC